MNSSRSRTSVEAQLATERGVIVSLWEKFVSEEVSEAVDAKPTFAVRGAWPVEDASRSLRHESAVGHVTGKALYVDRYRPAAPHARGLAPCSPHARAKILRRDSKNARAVPGGQVRSPRHGRGRSRTKQCRSFPPRRNACLWTPGMVCYHGHIVAIVVRLDAWRLARRRPHGSKSTTEPQVRLHRRDSPRRSNRTAYHTDPHMLARGDCAAALQAPSTSRLRGEFSYGGQEHFYLETQAAWAEGRRRRGRRHLVVHPSTCRKSKRSSPR